MTRRFVLFALAALAGCAHAKDAEIVSAAESRPTIGFFFTADLTRLQAMSGAGQGQAALAALLASHLATVGLLRTDWAVGDQVDVIADLPAPGWALRARIARRPEQMCQVALEPIVTAPAEHAAVAAPWSVQDALEALRRQVLTLQPARSPPMDAARFARLRAEAAAAAAEGRDPPLSPSDYVRVPRALSAEGAAERPYYTPPAETSGLKQP